MRPTSAREPKDIATGTRRKWGGRRGGKSLVVAGNPCLYGTSARAYAPVPAPSVAANPQSAADFESSPGIFLTVQGARRLVVPGRKRNFAMFEAVTAFMGLVSTGVFLAHAFEGVRSRA